MTSSIRRDAAQQEPDAELRAYDEFRADLKFLATEYDELKKHHPDQWVAIHNRRLVATASELGDLLGCLGNLGLADRSPVIEFVRTTPQVL
jgi:hypothetical protein